MCFLRYLANRYGSAPYWPPDLEARTQIDKWAEWSKINVALNFTGPIVWRVVHTAPQDRDEAAIERAIGILGNKRDIAETQLGCHAYLAGDKFTFADIQFGHLSYRYFDIAIDRPERPVRQRYCDRLTERPEFSEHVMVSHEGIEGKVTQ